MQDATALDQLRGRMVDGQPQHDMISVWTQSEIDGRPMTDGEIVSECLLLVDGGAETTRTVIANTILTLCRFPEQRQRLLDQPELLDGPAVEEFIRWTTPILNMSRGQGQSQYGAAPQLPASIFPSCGHANNQK